MTKKEDQEYRNKIIELGKLNGLYFVSWEGHFDNYFCICDKSQRKDLDYEVYGAIFESFFDLVKNDNELIDRFSRKTTWKANYNELVRWCKKKHFKLL